MNIQEIQQVIPHRPPFLLVDRIDSLTPGERAQGKKLVTINEPFFQGHYPGEPIMPGVLIIEALAQVGAVALLSQEADRGSTPYFGGINHARFKQKVVPGDVLTLEVEIVRRKGPVGIGKGVASVEGTIVAEAELVFVLSRQEG